MADSFDEMALLEDEIESIRERASKREAVTTRRVSNMAFSHLIGNFWLPVSAAFFALGFFINQAPLIIISLLFFFTGAIARLWERYCLSRVEYRRRLSSYRAYYGDNIYLDIAVSNRKPMPLPWFHIEEEIPEDLTLLKGKATPSSRDRRVTITNFLSLGWYNRITRRYPIQCNQRGLFVFGPTVLRSGDLFGIFNRQTVIKDEHYLMVYPRVVPLESLGIPSRQLFGDIRTRSHIFEDPILTLGVRDYQFGDSLKRIHWKATARERKLQTKVFELTTTTDLTLFLDVRTTKPAIFGSVPDLLELAIVTAASISNHAITAGYRTGLYANNRKRFPDEPIRLPPGQHADQMMRILEALSQVTAFETTPMSRLIQNESRNLSWGSTVVVITAMPADTIISTLLNMRKSGRKVILIAVGGKNPPVTPQGLSVYHVSEDISWRDIDTLSMKGA